MSLADRQRLYDRIKIAAKRYDNKPQPIYLTIVIYKRDIEGERIVPEFYCQDCAIAKHKEMGTELTGFSVLENGIAASMERKVKLTLGYDGLDMPCQGCYELDSQITNYQAVRLVVFEKDKEGVNEKVCCLKKEEVLNKLSSQGTSVIESVSE
ncbi:15535_t:CDS:2 [Entrophospora sp. SA101]|nr:15535_t:CDS:2 [Entrophospora sp. SA101]CAJ0851506.1 781_t:CDS:2 [Entrophospora sp. SA101]